MRPHSTFDQLVLSFRCLSQLSSFCLHTAHFQTSEAFLEIGIDYFEVVRLDLIGPKRADRDSSEISADY